MAGLHEVRASSNDRVTRGQGQQQWLGYTRSGPVVMAGLHDVKEPVTGCQRATYRVTSATYRVMSESQLQSAFSQLHVMSESQLQGDVREPVAG